MGRAFPFQVVSLLAFAMILSTFGAGAQTQAPPTPAPTNKWQPVFLPFRPVNITGIADTLWVCGADEMIAQSSDGGRNWKLMHQKPDGDVLLTIYFANEKIGFAAGTNGRFLSTNDAGET